MYRVQEVEETSDLLPQHLEQVLDWPKNESDSALGNLGFRSGSA